MLEANRSITVINRTYDGKTDTETEVSTVLDGVSIYSNRSVTIGSKGAESTDLVKIRIPYELPDGVWVTLGVKIIVDRQEMTILRARNNMHRRCFPHWYLEAE